MRTYSKRDLLPKKFAQNIVYRLNPELFIESLNERSISVLEMLAEDFKSYDGAANSGNIASKLANVFVEIIRISAGMVQPALLERQKEQENEISLKNKYGEFLINETNYVCPFPGCGRSLVVSNDTRATNSFNVALIDKEKEPSIDNLIALCPHHYATYLIDNSLKSCKELKGIKKILTGHLKSVQLIDTLPLEKGLISVISKIKKLNEKDFVDSSLDPKEIKQKISPSEDFALYSTVMHYVTTYYVKLHSIMMNADKRKEFDYREVQFQIHSIYLRLKKANKTKVEIFNEIVQKVQKVSLQDDIYCQIVVSYFVQSCEVFDAIS